MMLRNRLFLGAWTSTRSDRLRNTTLVHTGGPRNARAPRALPATMQCRVQSLGQGAEAMSTAQTHTFVADTAGGAALTGGRCDSRHRGWLRGPHHPRRRTAWFENLEWVCMACAGHPVAVEGTHGHWRRPVQGRAAAASIHRGRQHLFTHIAQTACEHSAQSPHRCWLPPSWLPAMVCEEYGGWVSGALRVCCAIGGSEEADSRFVAVVFWPVQSCWGQGEKKARGRDLVWKTGCHVRNLQP